MMKIVIGLLVLTAVMYVWAWTLARAAKKGDGVQGIGSPAFDPIRDRIRSRRKDASGTRP